MTPEEQIVADVKKAIEEKGYVNAAGVEKAIGDALKAYKPEEVEAMKTTIEEMKAAAITQGEAMAKLKTQVVAGKTLPTIKEGIRQVLTKAIEGKTDTEIRDMIKNGGLNVVITKAAGTMQVSTNVTGNDVGRVTVNPVWDEAPLRAPFIRQFIGAVSTNAPTERVVELINPDGDAAWTAEGALKPLVDFDMKTTDFNAKEVSDATEVSEKMLYDIDRLMGVIERRLINKIDLKEENGILNGTGAANDPIGLTVIASAFTLVGIVTENPTNYDALIAAYTQLLSLEYQPNAVFINPIDWANMKMKKASDGQYVLNLPGQVIDGLSIVPKNGIPVGYFLMGDMTKADLLDYKPLEIVPGYTGDNFRKGIVTLRAIKEVIFYAPNQQHNAFIYDQFAVVKEAITEVVA